MKKVKLILGIINQHPAGLGSAEYERKYQARLKPFLKTLYNFDEIPMTFYFSGSFLKWINAKHQEVFMIINEMVKRKQLELLGGGFYDPVLSLIPSSDRTGQIEALTTYLRKNFGKRPRGGWITEMIWEPSLPISLKNSGIDYVFLNDSYLKIAGLRGGELLNVCLTEDQGKTLKVFPLYTELRKVFRNADPEEGHRQLLALKKKQEKTSSLGDIIFSVFLEDNILAENLKEGEKNDTHPWWDRFFTLLSGDKENFELTLPGQWHQNTPGGRKIYFPCLIPAGLVEDNSRNAQGTTFRNFLSRYREINLFYAKMLYVGNMVNQIKGDRSRKKSAREELWRAQGNRHFWYNRLEGPYYRSIRQNGWEAVLEAEKLTREKGIFHPNLTKIDFDMDGRDEYLYQGESLNAYVHSRGGRTFELDYLKRPWNYQDTHCHWKDSEGERDSFVDSFVYPQKDDGGDSAFQEGRFSLAQIFFDDEILEREKKRISFKAELDVPDEGGAKRPILFSKTYAFGKNDISVLFTITNLQDRDFAFHFTTQLNLALNSDQGKNMVFQYLSRGQNKQLEGNAGICRNVKSFEIRDGHNKATLFLDSTKNFELQIVRREVLDPLSEDPLYQGTGFELGWKKRVGPRKPWSVEVNFRIDRR